MKVGCFFSRPLSDGWLAGLLLRERVLLGGKVDLLSICLMVVKLSL